MLVPDMAEQPVEEQLMEDSHVLTKVTDAEVGSQSQAAGYCVQNGLTCSFSSDCCSGFCSLDYPYEFGTCCPPAHPQCSPRTSDAGVSE